MNPKAPPSVMETTSVIPVHYSLSLEPDLQAFSFEGKAELHVRAGGKVHYVTVNALELVIHGCRLRQQDSSWECTVTVDAARQEAEVHFPQQVQGDFSLVFDYTGRINDQYAGLYRSQYEVNGRRQVMASTQFQASDARRMFPCFDHPGHKATFDLELVLEADLMVVSNTEVQQSVMLDSHRKRVQFERTPPMPTYLLFLGIGHFEASQVEASGYRVRVLTAPGKQAYGRFALEMALQSLQFCQAYTGFPYPLSKCDLIAVPDSIGAMENFGAIRHSEDVLLVYPGQTPLSTQVLIGQIIAHEVSHMWFGNLVTPADWKYLWLSESFATYFTFVIPEALYPEWHIWDDFAADRMRPGLNRDGLLETRPVELAPGQALPGDPAPTPASAPIVYNKGAAVLRMLAAYVGEASFRQGLKGYLRACQFQSIPSQRFWQTFAAGIPGDLQSFADAWIYQPGFPLVTAAPSPTGLRLRQQRFTYSPSSEASLWPIPIELLIFDEDGRHQRRSLVLHEREMEIPLPLGTAAYQLNHNQQGFYRVNYPAENLARLGGLIAGGRLNALDSFNIQNDLFALVQRGSVTPRDYLAFVAAYLAGERRYLPLLDLMQNLRQLYLLVPVDFRPTIADIGRPLAKAGLDHVGFLPQPGESHQQVRLRLELLWAAGLFGTPAVRQFGLEQFECWRQGEAVAADILPAVLRLGALADPRAWPILWERSQTGERPESERRHILEAVGLLPEQDALHRALAANLERTPKSLRTVMIAATADNPAAISFMTDWLLDQRPALAELPAGQLARALVQLIPLCGIGREGAAADLCQHFGDSQPRLGDTLAMAREWLAINQRLYDKLGGNEP